jgi:hypothetical protein
MQDDLGIRPPGRLPLGGRRTAAVKVGGLYRWRFLRRCAVCGRIGLRGYERSERGWVCLDRERCAKRRMSRRA